MRAWRGALAAVAAAALSGCGRPTDPLLRSPLWVWVPDSGATLVHGYWSGFTAAERLVITDQERWAAAWQKIAGTSAAPDLPAVDFADHTVLVAAMGTRSSGGNDVRIDSLGGTGLGALVHVTETSPGPSCVVAAVITSPVHAILIASAVHVLEWRVRQVVRSCD